MTFFLRYVLPVLAVLALLWAAYAWRQADIRHWKNEGRAELALEIKQAQESADAETRKKQAAIKTETRKATHEVRKQQGADAPASPYLRGVLDRLRADD